VGEGDGLADTSGPTAQFKFAGVNDVLNGKILMRPPPFQQSKSRCQAWEPITVINYSLK
jgi:hypothetical protein